MGRKLRSAGPAIALMAMALTAIAPASGARAGITAAQSAAAADSAVASGATVGQLNGVAAISAGDVWAVGYRGDSPATNRTLIMHWNGERWSVVTSPKPIAGVLTGVTAVSAHDAWAVGVATNAAGAHPKALVMHWNGKSWQRQASASAVAGVLAGVAATAKTAWAVGATTSAPALTLHLIAGRWYVIPTPNFQLASLNSVVMGHGGITWAAGSSFYANSYHGLIVHWTGRTWKPVASPLQGPGNIQFGIAAGPRGAMWAVGDYWSSTSTLLHGTSMLWDGKKWHNVSVPLAPNHDQRLSGVTFIPGGTAWAVGRDSGRSVILHWNGKAWTRSASPNLGSGGTDLYSVAAISKNDAWAVGFSWFDSAEPPQITILHWNGQFWS